VKLGDDGKVAIKDKNFGCIRNLPVAETRPEHFDRAIVGWQGVNQCLSAADS
jgi:hypothetical protein